MACDNTPGHPMPADQGGWHRKHGASMGRAKMTLRIYELPFLPVTMCCHVTSWLQDLSGLQFINWLCQWTLGVYCCLEYFFLLSKIDWQRLPVSPVDFSYQAREPHAQFLWLLTSFPEDSHLTRRGLGCYPKWPMADWGGVATGSVSLPLGRTTLVLYLHTNTPCGISQKLRFSKTMVLPSFSSHPILFPFLSYRFFLKASISKPPVQTPLPQVLRPGNPG